MSEFKYDDENGFIPVPVTKILADALTNMLWVSMFVLSVTYLTTHAWR